MMMKLSPEFGFRMSFLLSLTWPLRDTVGFVNSVTTECYETGGYFCNELLLFQLLMATKDTNDVRDLACSPSSDQFLITPFLLFCSQLGNVAEPVMRAVVGPRVSGLAYPPVTQQESYDYRYEFSETRKVLEEFFKAENEFPASSQERRGEVDLDYSLTRLNSGSSYVAQRLADPEQVDVVPVVPLPPYSQDLLDLVDTIPPLPNIRQEPVH